MQVVETSSCGFVYSDTGGDGPVVVLLHGVLMNGTLLGRGRRKAARPLPLHCP